MGNRPRRLAFVLTFLGLLLTKGCSQTVELETEPVDASTVDSENNGTESEYADGDIVI